MADSIFVKTTELKRFISDCLRKVGVNDDHASITAEILVYFDTVGIDNRGLGDVQQLIHEIRCGIVKPNAVPRINKELDSAVWVSGNDGLGYVTGNFCMKMAIKKAIRSGLCIVVATNSTNFGSASYYAQLAANFDLIGFAFSNASCNTLFPRSTKPGVGTNSLAMAAPGKDNESILLDMACSMTSEERLRSNKGEISQHWALDIDRKPTTNPRNAVHLQPLGFTQNTEFKGAGLAMMVDVLSGLLGGSNYGPYVTKRRLLTLSPNLGQCFIAINPGCFAPGFCARLTDLIKKIRLTEPLTPGIPVNMPGDRKKNHIKQVTDNGGIQLTEDQIKTSKELSKALRIRPLETFKR